MFNRKANRFIAFVLLILFALGLPAYTITGSQVDAREEQLEYRFVSNRKGVNIRSGPGENYPLYGYAINNTSFEGVRDGAWFKVDNGDGYVYIAYKFTKPFERDMDIRYIGANRANVRAGKNVNSKLVDRTYKNDTYIGRKNGAWFETFIDGRPVYIAYNLTRQNKIDQEYRYISGNGINIRSAPSTKARIVGKIYLNEEVEGTKIGNWFKIDQEGKTGFISYSWTSDKLNRSRYSKKTGANIRSGPSTSYKSLGRTIEGQKFVGHKQGAWLKTKYKGKTAYIAYNLTQSSPGIKLDFQPRRVNFSGINKNKSYARFSDFRMLEPLEAHKSFMPVFSNDLLGVDVVNSSRPGYSILEYYGNRYYAPRTSYNLIKLDYKNSYLDQIPFKYRRYVSGVRVTDGLDDEIAAMYSNYSKHIDTLEEYRYDKEIIYHEVAHGISFNADRRGVFLHDLLQWKNIWKEEWQGRKGYGSENEAEGFAEAFTSYVCGQAAHYHGDLASEKPLSYDYMRSLVRMLPDN